MLRCLVRLRPPALLIARTPSGTSWAVVSAWVAGYGDILSFPVAALSCTMLPCLVRQCAFCLQIASPRRCAFTLRWFCCHKTLDIFIYPFIYFYFVIFAYDTTRHYRSGFNDNMKVQKYLVLSIIARIGICQRPRYGGIFSLSLCWYYLL